MSLRSLLCFITVCLAVSLVISCRRSDENLEPAFISINEHSFQSGPGQGSNSTGLTEFWCYTDGDILGVVDTPVSLPLLKQGRQTINVFPGIKNNGMGVSRIRYPFYTSFDTTLDVVPGETYQLNPRFSYLSTANVDADRDFNSGNFFTPGTSNNGEKDWVSESGFPASGMGCGLFRLPADAALLHYRDITSFSLTSGSVAFMEMDYSCNNTFSVGVFVNQGGSLIQVPVLYLTPTQTGSDVFPNWNKIYMDLGMVAKQYPNASTYLLYIECSRNEASVPVIYLDDIKIVK
jgi:hypothetical protein